MVEKLDVRAFEGSELSGSEVKWQVVKRRIGRRGITEDLTKFIPSCYTGQRRHRTRSNPTVVRYSIVLSYSQYTDCGLRDKQQYKHVSYDVH